MGERLRLAREAANFKSASKAADALGVSASSYRAHENGQNEFGPEIAQAYARKFGTTAAYLLTGEGPMKNGRPGASLVSSYDPDEPEQENVEGAAYSRDRWSPTIAGAVPELDLKVGAGLGIVGDVINLPTGAGNISGHRVVSEWLIPGEYLRNEAKVQASVTIITEIIGDSMTPTYMPGDRVIVDLSQNKLVTDTVYVISDGEGEPQIKRLQRVPFSDPAQVLIISDNPNLQTFTVELDKLTIIGRICGHIARK
nr:LexA family transcriptional regulator [Pararhizobium capsulatum]